MSRGAGARGPVRDGARRTPALDALDIDIIRALQRDGRAPFSALAAALGVSEGTIRNRMGRLRADGTMRVVGVANPFKVGMQVVAIIGLNVARARLRQALRRLQALEAVRYVALTTGTFDFIVEVVLPSTEDLLRFLTDDLSRIPGILRTETSLALAIEKQSYTWLPPARARPARAARRRP